MKPRIALALFLALAMSAALAASGAQSAFDHLKSLAGTWEGKGPDGKTVEVDYRVTSGGSALMSEIKGGEDMITMFHMDNDRLLMTHYCGAGNQPRMQATASPDGKSITFDFVDGTNITPQQPGHMKRLVISLPDADHHSEEWTFAASDGKEMRERFELTRKK